MSILLPVSVALIALCILWLPTYSVALMLRGMGAPRPFAGLKVVLALQLAGSVGLVLLAGALGLRNPAGYTLAILLVASMAGAVFVWRRGRAGI
ncbi:hypothetical protein QMK61_13770 [Fulvimonas sp. R45]|uniref:hypothetical protein n=1 Tax=Fulvimonas sp. R45 TaxID=3045937 RepID=UPI00265D9B07|nr:hypothetical protein [Fulvimonas sp. R45]MDO1529902.1 hypothetical protein [Fulvimonas sp. R45]